MKYPFLSVCVLSISPLIIRDKEVICSLSMGYASVFYVTEICKNTREAWPPLKNVYVIGD
jgi:hypothetical protein